MAHALTAFLHSVCASGPLVVLLYFLAVFSIPAAGIIAWQSHHATTCYAVALLPLAFESMATWVSLHAATIMLTGTRSLSGDTLPPAIDVAKQSLLTGWIGASIALVLVAIVRRRRKSAAPRSITAP